MQIGTLFWWPNSCQPQEQTHIFYRKIAQFQMCENWDLVLMPKIVSNRGQSTFVRTWKRTISGLKNVQIGTLFWRPIWSQPREQTHIFYRKNTNYLFGDISSNRGGSGAHKTGGGVLLVSQSTIFGKRNAWHPSIVKSLDMKRYFSEKNSFKGRWNLHFPPCIFPF